MDGADGGKTILTQTEEEEYFTQVGRTPTSPITAVRMAGVFFCLFFLVFWDLQGSFFYYSTISTYKIYQQRIIKK